MCTSDTAFEPFIVLMNETLNEGCSKIRYIGWFRSDTEVELRISSKFSFFFSSWLVVVFYCFLRCFML